MPSSVSNDPKKFDEKVASPGFTQLLFVAFGVAMLLGLVSGAVWIVWNLLKVRLG